VDAGNNCFAVEKANDSIDKPTMDFDSISVSLLLAVD